MADITSGRGRRMLSVGRLTTEVGGSYLWQALKRPFRSASRAQQELLAAHVRNAERAVMRSTQLRGAFMKLTQMLSMRTDLFPAEALEVLSVVQSSVPPMPYERVREVILAELGAPPEERFARFEREAFAAASLGQVHRATLANGEAVAVKVQYPGVAETVQQDLENVKALLRVLTALARDVMRQDVDPKAISAELEARLHEELDYLQEAGHLERFRALFADDRAVMIPRVHRAFTTRRVLTMEFLDGYPIQDIMAPGVDQKLKDWVAVKLFCLLWRQVLEFGVLHTDPHPGNYVVTHHPKLGILDFGSVRVFEPEVRRGYLRLARGLVGHDDGEIGAACVALGFVRDDPAPLVEMMHIICEPLECDAPFDPCAYDLMERTARVTQVAFEHRLFRTPGHQVFLLRALLGLDAYLKAFGTVRNWHRLFRDIVERGRDVMKRWFALSAIGRDRPGIVADLAELIYECDCNLEDSSMTILGSEFAVLLLLSGEGTDVERRLSTGCKRLEWEKRLTVFFRPLEEPPHAAHHRGATMECVVTGVDKAGIVARVARTLAEHGINVTDLRTESRPEPESGTPIYTMRIQMGVPRTVDRGVLRERLERVAAELRVDLTLRERAGES